MFYDERIEFEKGRISRNCIFIAVIISLYFCIAQLANILLNIKAPQFHHFMNPLLSVFIFISGTASLIYGLYIEKSENDERTKAEAYAFYSKAAQRIIILTAVLFGILLPYTMINPMPSYSYYDIPFFYVLWILFYPLCTYCVYSFKKNEIYFNYSLLESEHYYKGVLKNIGKFSLWALGIFAGSIIFYILFYTLKYIKQPLNNIGNHIEEMFSSALGIFFIFAVLYIILSLLYLSLSYLEKSSYDNETRLISLATVISIAMAACLTVAVFFFITEVTRIVEELIKNIASSNTTIPIGSIVAAASYITNLINSAIYIFMILCITYFGYEYGRIYKNRLLSGALRTILAIKAVDMAITPLLSMTIVLIQRSTDLYDDSIIIQYNEFTVYCGYLINLAEIAAVILLIAALMKDGMARKVCTAIICIIAIALCIMIFLNTQLNAEEFLQAKALFRSFIYLCLAVLVAIIVRKNIHSIDK